MNTFKKYREQNNMTQEELAKKIGMTQRMIAYYESGEKIPSGKTILRLKKLFNISADELLSDYTPNSLNSSDEKTDNNTT